VPSFRDRLPLAYRTVILAAVLVVAGLLIKQLITLLLAILITIIIAIPLSAFASRLERLHVPRVLAALLGLLIALAVIGGVLALVIPPFVSQVNHFIDQLPKIVHDIEHEIEKLTGAKPREVGASVQKFVRGYTDHPGKLIGPATSIGRSLAAVVGSVIVVVLTALFISIRPEPLVGGALRLFPPDRRGHALHVMRRLRTAWLGWMTGVVISMVVLGTLFYLGMLIVGLHFAVVFAVISALAVVVPYFGALASGIPPVLYALTISPGKALAVLAVYLIVHQIEGNIVAPLVMARTARLHPALIAIGVVISGALFGVLGLIIAVPLISLALILVEEIWVRPMERRSEPWVELPAPRDHEELTGPRR
jgi:predicted PurR-regulated permease PerM